MVTIIGRSIIMANHEKVSGNACYAILVDNLGGVTVVLGCKNRVRGNTNG
jgi:hypothetical protein